MLVHWISNSRRAHQRMGFLKVVLDHTNSFQSSTDLAERVRPKITAGFELGDRADILNWCKESRNGLLLSDAITPAVQAQGYYLFHLYSRSGWLSPKGINEYVEVLPRRFGLTDSLFRLTEVGHTFMLLVPPDEATAWSQPRADLNPLALPPAQKYFLTHQMLDADGDFLIPWIGAIARSFRHRDFTYLQAGECMPEVLRDLIAGFSGSAYLDVDREQLRALESTRARVLSEIEVKKEKEGSGARRDQLAVPRLEWLVDVGVLAKPRPDDLTYSFTDLGATFAERALAAYELAAKSGYPDRALQSVLNTRFAELMASQLGMKSPKPPIDVVAYLRPAFDLVNSITGYCLLRPLNLLAAIVASTSGQSLTLEYDDTVRMVEEASKSRPDQLHYTVDRLTTDYQVKLFVPT